MQLINPPNPVPDGLLDAISAAGHFAIPSAGGWVVDDVASVQAIIAAYSTTVAPQLASLRVPKLTALVAKYEAVIAVGRFYSVTGGIDPSQHTYQIDEASQFNITSMGAWAGNSIAGIAGTAAWPAQFAWSDAFNNLVPMTAAQCYAFSQNVALYVQSVIANYFILRAEISLAGTVVALNAIDVTSGWPSNT